MDFEIVGYQVLLVKEEVTLNQKAIVKTHYDMVKHTEILAPSTIPIGQPTTVQVLCKNYLGELLAEENTPITVEVNGVSQDFIPQAGIIEFTVTCDLAGDIEVKTSVEYWRNDEKSMKVV